MELSFDRLTKQYGSKIAVDRVSATLSPGVYGLLGANGAGKSTLMRMLCAILKSTSGEVYFDENEVTAMGADYRNILGYLPQDFGYYPNYTAEEFLMYIAALKGIAKKYARKRTKELLEIVDLSHAAAKKVKTFSGGMKQRVGIAQALLNDPKVLILDEPTAGLDPKERVRLRNLLADYAGNKIVLLSTHIVSDIEAIADEELFRMEHKKLWRKASVKVCVLVCFTYMVIFGSVLSFQWFSLGSMSGYETGFGNNFDGYCVIRGSQEYTAPFRGDLTDETVQRLVRDYQRVYNAGMVADSQKTDYLAVNTWLQMLWPKEKDGSSYDQMITYVDPDRLTGLYERRARALDNFLENSNQTGDEKAYIMEMEENVEKPFRYDWTRGWSALLGDILPDLSSCLAPFIAIVLSSLFSGEWHDRTASLVLTTKNGWKEIARAKICTGLVFTAELFALLVSGMLVSQLFFLGTGGWNMPIQNIKMLAVAPMNMLQAEIYELAFALLGAVGYAGIVMLASAAVKSNVLALLLSLAVVYVPPMLMNYCPLTIQKALELIPLVGSSADIFRTNTFHVFGRYLWSPYLLISVPILIGLLCIPLAIKDWSRRLKV